MNSEIDQELPENKEFGEALEKLSFNALRVVLAIILRGVITDEDEFRHVINLTGESLREALEEAKASGTITDEATQVEGKAITIYRLSPGFTQYWEQLHLNA